MRLGFRKQACCDTGIAADFLRLRRLEYLMIIIWNLVPEIKIRNIYATLA